MNTVLIVDLELVRRACGECYVPDDLLSGDTEVLPRLVRMLALISEDIYSENPAGLKEVVLVSLISPTVRQTRC